MVSAYRALVMVRIALTSKHGISVWTIKLLGFQQHNVVVELLRRNVYRFYFMA